MILNDSLCVQVILWSLKRRLYFQDMFLSSEYCGLFFDGLDVVSWCFLASLGRCVVFMCMESCLRDVVLQVV